MKKISIKSLVDSLFDCLEFGRKKKGGGLTLKELRKRVESNRKKAREERLKEIEGEDTGPDFPNTGGLGMHGPGC